MQIDWFTVAAQAFNFLLLAALLWWVLYRPVRRTVEDREEEIARRLEEAEDERKEAEKLKEDYREREKALEEERKKALAEAEEEAEDRRRALEEDLREEMEEKRKEWREAVLEERDDFLDDLSRTVREETFRVIRRGLEELVEARPEDAFLETFLRRAREMETEERDAFVAAVVKEGGEVELRTALELSDDARDRMTELVREWVSRAEAEREEAGGEKEAEVEVGLVVAREEEGPRGLELRAGSRKIAWSVDAFVQGIREEVEKIMEEDLREAEERQGEEEEEEEGSGE